MMNEAVAKNFGQLINHLGDDAFWLQKSTNEIFLELRQIGTDVFESVAKKIWIFSLSTHSTLNFNLVNGI